MNTRGFPGTFAPRYHELQPWKSVALATKFGGLHFAVAHGQLDDQSCAGNLIPFHRNSQ